MLYMGIDIYVTCFIVYMFGCGAEQGGGTGALVRCGGLTEWRRNWKRCRVHFFLVLPTFCTSPFASSPRILWLPFSHSLVCD